MEPDQRLILWSLTHKDRLGLEITNIEWPKNYDVRLCDVHCRMQYKGVELEGRGTDLSADKALAKALTEMFERTAVVSGQVSDSNGVAAHTEPHEAEKLARKELLERDAFLMSHFCRLPVVALDWASCDLSEPIRRLLGAISKSGVTMNLYSLGQSFDQQIVLCTAFGFKVASPFGLCMGLGCDSDQAAAAKATIECARHVLAVLHGQERVPPLSLGRFQALFNPTLRDRIALGMDLEFALFFRDDLQSRLGLKQFHFRPEGEFIFEHLTLDTESLQGLPLHVSRAKNSSLQSLIWSSSLHQLESTDRFKWHIGFTVSPQPQMLPHPLA